MNAYYLLYVIVSLPNLVCRNIDIYFRIIIFDILTQFKLNSWLSIHTSRSLSPIDTLFGTPIVVWKIIFHKLG